MNPSKFLESTFNPRTSYTAIKALDYEYGDSSLYRIGLIKFSSKDDSFILIHEGFEVQNVKIILNDSEVIEPSYYQFDSYEYSEYELDNGHSYVKISIPDFTKICMSTKVSFWIYEDYSRVRKLNFRPDEKNKKNLIPYFRAFYSLTIDSSLYVDDIKRIRKINSYSCRTKSFLFF